MAGSVDAEREGLSPILALAGARFKLFQIHKICHAASGRLGLPIPAPLRFASQDWHRRNILMPSSFALPFLLANLARSHRLSCFTLLWLVIQRWNPFESQV